jgi:hypothetical protein
MTSRKKIRSVLVHPEQALLQMGHVFFNRIWCWYLDASLTAIRAQVRNDKDPQLALGWLLRKLKNYSQTRRHGLRLLRRRSAAWSFLSRWKLRRSEPAISLTSVLLTAIPTFGHANVTSISRRPCQHEYDFAFSEDRGRALRYYERSGSALHRLCRPARVQFDASDIFAGLRVSQEPLTTIGLGDLPRRPLRVAISLSAQLSDQRRRDVFESLVVRVFDERKARRKQDR